MPIIKLSIECISINQAHSVDETYAPDQYITWMMRLQLEHVAMVLQFASWLWEISKQSPHGKG